MLNSAPVILVKHTKKKTKTNNENRKPIKPKPKKPSPNLGGIGPYISIFGFI
jgi:hypothetical protein